MNRRENNSDQPEEFKTRLPGARVLRRARIRKLAGLPRVLGVSALFSTAYGNVGSSIYYALGVTAVYALGLTPAVFVFAGILFAFTAMTYAEGTAAIPEAGGSSSFARHGFNELVSFFAAWALLLGYIVTISISAFSVPHYMAIFSIFAPLGHYPYNVAMGILIIVALMLINIKGLKEAALVNISLTVADLLTQIALIAIGGWLLFDSSILTRNVQLGVVPTWNQAIFGISFAMIAYTGIETVSNMAEETASPEKAIPQSITLIFIAVMVMFTGISVIALSAMPVYPKEIRSANAVQPINISPEAWVAMTPAQQEQKLRQIGATRTDPRIVWSTELADRYLEDPVLGIAHKLPEGRLSRGLGYWIGFLATTILVVATNAGIIGVSRLTFSMGIYQQLPPVLSRVHRRYRTPYVSISLFCIVAAALILPGKIEFLAEMYVFGAVLAFFLAHISILALRVRHPDMPRPFKIPFNLKFGRTHIPVPALLGAVGTLATWGIIVYTRDMGRIVGSVWLVAGMILYLAYRRYLGLSPVETHKRTTRV